MPGSGETGGRKGPQPVEVIYFPKKVTPPRMRSSVDVPADPSSTRTIEFRPFAEAEEASEQEVPTEPFLQLPRERITPKETRVPSPRQNKARTPKRKADGAGSTKRRRSSEKVKRVTLEVDTDPALRYHVQKLEELLASPVPAEPLKSMDRMQLAQMALFGHQLFESGKLDEARVVFEGLVGLNVPDAFPHTMLGTVYLAMGKPDRAAALFEAALAIDAGDIAARVYRAEIQLAQGRGRSPLAELEKVVDEGPLSDPFVERARRLLRMAGDRQKRRR